VLVFSAVVEAPGLVEGWEIVARAGKVGTIVIVVGGRMVLVLVAIGTEGLSVVGGAAWLRFDCAGVGRGVSRRRSGGVVGLVVFGVVAGSVRC
jgi:hypothetical protein